MSPQNAISLGGWRSEKNKTAAKFHSTVTDTAAIFGTTEGLTADRGKGAEPAGRSVPEKPVRGGPVEFSLETLIYGLFFTLSYFFS